MSQPNSTYMVEFYHPRTNKRDVWGDNLSARTAIEACLWLIEEAAPQVLVVTNNSTKQELEIS